MPENAYLCLEKLSLPPASPEDGEADGAGSAGGGSDEGPSSPRTYTYSVSAEGFRPLKKISVHW